MVAITDITFLMQPAFLIFAIPIFGAVISLFIDKISSRLRSYFSVLTIFISALAGIWLVIAQQQYELIVDLMPSTGIGVFFKTSLNVDPLSSFMALIATGLGCLIALFSLEYMREDDAQTRYFFFIQLFVGGMALLVLAGDLILLYFGWKIVGICSYFLIAHWFHKPDPQGILCAKSGIKAFLMTLVGDILLLAGLGILWLQLGSVNISTIAQNFGSVAPDLQVLVALLIFAGAVGKSAQFPLITWLSSPRSVDIDAMQGPTTVSALIHAATMVKAGVYLMSRFFFVLASQPIDLFFIVIAVIAAITAFIAAASALVSIDIKRVLAYSTVSQLAYMFMGLAVGYIAYVREEMISIEGFMAAQFHVLSHATFKGLLFLSAGAIIHSLHNERNIRKMGGLRKDFPFLHISMLIGVLALAGFPLITNGGYSKEAVIGSALELALSDTNLANFGLLMYIVSVVTALMTAIYAFRFFFLIFYGEKPEGLEVHKPGPLMRGITLGLAGTVIVTGILGPVLMNNFFAPMFQGLDYHNPLKYPWELLLDLAQYQMAFLSMLLVIALVIIGILFSYIVYVRGPRTTLQWRKSRPINALYVIAREGFYLDALYQGGQDLFMWLNWKLRPIQSGDLNYNMTLVGIVGLGIMVFLLFIL
ncbi:MAG: NADH-quinone oxidoreductase subunit L [Promethearchaeota archaeon]